MRLLPLAGALALACSLSACAGLPGGVVGGSGFDLNKFLTDPACAHDDEASGVVGAAGVPASLQFKVARHCPGAPGTAAPAAPPAAPAATPSP